MPGAEKIDQFCEQKLEDMEDVEESRTSRDGMPVSGTEDPHVAEVTGKRKRGGKKQYPEVPLILIAPLPLPLLFKRVIEEEADEYFAETEEPPKKRTKTFQENLNATQGPYKKKGECSKSVYKEMTVAAGITEAGDDSNQEEDEGHPNSKLSWSAFNASSDETLMKSLFDSIMKERNKGTILEQALGRILPSFQKFGSARRLDSAAGVGESDESSDSDEDYVVEEEEEEGEDEEEYDEEE